MTNRLSIVIPLFNASAYIEPCLAALNAQTLVGSEIILVDDGSTDDTLQKLEKFKFKVVKLGHNQGAAAARNEGERSASGDIVVFVDVDVLLGPLALEQMARHFPGQAHAVSALYTQDTSLSNWPSEFQNLLSLYRHSQLPIETPVIFSFLLAIQRDKFKEVGGFNEQMRSYEDVELGHRLREKGLKTMIDPTLTVHHVKLYNYRTLLKEYFLKVRGEIEYNRKKNFFHRMNQDNCPFHLKAAGVLSGLVIPSVVLIPRAPVPCCLVLVLYFCLLSPALFFMVQKRGWGIVFKATVLFTAVSIASLMGAFTGLVRNSHE